MLLCYYATTYDKDFSISFIIGSVSKPTLFGDYSLFFSI